MIIELTYFLNAIDPQDVHSDSRHLNGKDFELLEFLHEMQFFKVMKNPMTTMTKLLLTNNWCDRKRINSEKTENGYTMNKHL